MSNKIRDYTSYIGRSLSDLLILGSLQEEENLSGYHIIKKIKKVSQGSIKFRAGTIYPRIEKLFESGLLSKTIEEDTSSSDAVRQTSTYSLSQKGKEYLLDKTHEWHTLQENINKILPPKERKL